MDDDWMNPSTSFSWSLPPPKNGTYYQIQRKRATPVSGNVSYIYSWDLYEEFESKEERDKELARLRDTTTWHLRARTARYVNGENMHRDPSEYMDFD